MPGLLEHHVHESAAPKAAAAGRIGADILARPCNQIAAANANRRRRDIFERCRNARAPAGANGCGLGPKRAGAKCGPVARPIGRAAGRLDRSGLGNMPGMPMGRPSGFA